MLIKIKNYKSYTKLKWTYLKGYGIHGETGKRRIEFSTCHEAVSILLRTLLESKEIFSKEYDIAVMITNLGGIYS